MRLWTCTRADLRRGGGSIVLLVLMAGIAGGVALAAIAGARRTTSSYERLLEAEHAPEILLFVQEQLAGEDLRELQSISDAKVGAFNIILLSSAETGIDRRSDLAIIAATDHSSLALVQPRFLEGRMPSPDHPEEVVVNELVADQLDLQPGDHFDVVGPSEAAFDCYVQTFCEDETMNEPVEVVVSGVMRLAGDLDPDAFNGALIRAGPGMNDLMPADYVRAVTVANVKLDGGLAGADAFLAELEGRFGDRIGEEIGYEVDDPTDRNITGALDVESRSLLVFAFFAAVAGLVASGQAFARHLAAGRTERSVLAVLGVTSRERALVTFLTGLLVAAAATAVALVVAVMGSAFLPVGLAHLAEPDPGIDIDSLVLGPGAAAVAAALIALFGALAWRAASRDTRPETAPAPTRPSRLAALPVVASVGVDIAMPRLRRSGAAPTIGAIAGLVVAVAVGAAATVITASNDDLQSTPELYGQPWDANASLAPSLAPVVARDLVGRDELTALALAAGGTLGVVGPGGDDIELAAVGFELLEGEMAPTILAGRAPQTAAEVALGSRTFEHLDVVIGDELRASDGATLTVVGRGIVPIVGADTGDDGAVLTLEGFEAHGTSDVPGGLPEVSVAFDVRPGEDVAALLDEKLGDHMTLLGTPVRTPTDITTLREIGRFPAAVALFTGLLASAAVGHALLVAVRRRSQDLATLRALGLRRRQTAGAVVWAGATLLVVGLLLGLPLGVAAGRLLWQAIADSIHVVNRPAFGWRPLVIVASIAAAATALATAWPTIRVLRIRLAEALRAE